MNYTELTAAIKGYAENDFPATVGSFTSADQIATFVRIAEQRIYNKVQLPAIRKNSTGNVTAGNKYLACPNDWLATFSLAVINSNNEYHYLLNKDVNFIRESFPDTDSAFWGEPQYYAQFDQNTFILGPTPDDNYLMELHYFYYPPSIVTAGTSWLGDNFDSVLLYGALLEAAAFMKSDTDTITFYKQRYEEAMQELKMLGDGKNRQDAYRSGQVRLPVTS
jgi:hypothetical protein